MPGGVRCVNLNLLIFFRIYEVVDKRFYGKFLAVMIQYLTFGTEKRSTCLTYVSRSKGSGCVQIQRL
jgi:hypothetical protein